MSPYRTRIPSPAESMSRASPDHDSCIPATCPGSLLGLGCRSFLDPLLAFTRAPRLRVGPGIGIDHSQPALFHGLEVREVSGQVGVSAWAW